MLSTLDLTHLEQEAAVNFLLSTALGYRVAATPGNCGITPKSIKLKNKIKINDNHLHVASCEFS